MREVSADIFNPARFVARTLKCDCEQRTCRACRRRADARRRRGAKSGCVCGTCDLCRERISKRLKRAGLPPLPPKKLRCNCGTCRKCKNRERQRIARLSKQSGAGLPLLPPKKQRIAWMESEESLPDMAITTLPEILDGTIHAWMVEDYQRKSYYARKR